MSNSSSSDFSIASLRPTVGFVDLEHRAYVVLDVEFAEDRGFLRQIADSEPRSLKHRQPGDVMAVQFDFALVGFDEAGDHVEDGRLAGPIWPQQTDRLAPSHRKADVLHHHSAAIALAEAMHRENPLPPRRDPSFGSRSVAHAAEPFAPARRRAYAVAHGAIAHRRPLASHASDAARRSAITGSYFDFAASAFVASAPDLVASALDFGTNCPCTRPDLALVSTVAKPFLRS